MNQKREILLKYWDYSKNEGLDPNSIPLNSDEAVNFECPKCEFEWESKISSFTTRCLDYGCAKCAGKRVFKTPRGRLFFESHPEYISWLDTSVNTIDQLSNETGGSKKRISLICPHCTQKFTSEIRSLINHSRHTSKGCLSAPSRNINKLVDKFESNARFVIYQVISGKDAPKLLLDVRMVLKKREMMIFKCVYLEGKTYEEIGKIFDVTRSRISEICNKINKQVIDLIDANNYDLHEFGKEPSKTIQELKFLKQQRPKMAKKPSPRAKPTVQQYVKAKESRKYVSNHPILKDFWDHNKNNEDPNKVFIKGNSLKYYWIKDGVSYYLNPVTAVQKLK